ncbi:MAG: hypothetical protein WBQ75_21875, partial [Acetobacteraceae bacterium]
AGSGVFAELRNEARFARVRLNDIATAVEWPEPCDADGYPVIEIDSDALFALGTEHAALRSPKRSRSTTRAA